jgi:hypothetical protein
MAGLVPLRDVLVEVAKKPDVARNTIVIPLALKGGQEDMVYRDTLLNHPSRLMIDDGMGTLTTQARFLGIIDPINAKTYAEAGDRIKRRKEQQGTFDIYSAGNGHEGSIEVNGHYEDYQLILGGLEQHQTPVLTTTKRNNGFVRVMTMRNEAGPQTIWSQRQTAELDNSVSLVIPEDKVIVGGSPEDFPYRDWGIRPSEMSQNDMDRLHANTQQALKNAGLWTAEFRLLAPLPDLVSLKQPKKQIITNTFITNLNTQFDN